MKRFPTYVFLGLFFFSICLWLSCNQEQEDSAEWIELFNGKDLSGWTAKIRGYSLGENYGNTFSVVDSLLTVNYAAYDSFDNRFGHLFYEKPFSHYKLRIEYRFTGDQVPGGPGWAFRNSGAMLHGQDPETMTLNQDFPVSIEAQLLGGNGTDPRTTSNLCTPGTHVVMDDELVTRHCISSSSKTYHGDQWVTADFIVRGSEIVYHILEGDTVIAYTNPQVGGLNEEDPYLKDHPDGSLISSGFISLQSESHPIQFRKVSLLDLSE